jgi:hypothetical protein
LTITGWDQGAKLKDTEARNLPKPVKVALKTRDKVAQTQDELLGRQSEPKGQRLILNTDQDSLVAIQD